MQYSYIDIQTFFKKSGYKMHAPRKGYGYIESAVKNKLGFVLYSDNKGVRFCWQVKKGETLLDDKLPRIQKHYPRVKTKQGSKNDEWTRLFISLDKSQPLTSALEVLKKTRRILGY